MDSILDDRKPGSDKKMLDFSKHCSYGRNSSIMFVRALVMLTMTHKFLWSKKNGLLLKTKDRNEYVIYVEDLVTYDYFVIVYMISTQTGDLLERALHG